MLHPQNNKRRKKIKAVLFDIDGTILNCNRAGSSALIKATVDTFETVGKMEAIDFQGKTDKSILIESLSIMGFSDKDIEEKSHILKEKYFHYLEKSINKYEVTVYPGIKDILIKLSAREDILLGLLTGNFTESARIKLNSHDLNRFFKFGAFGDDAPIRDLLPEVAKKRIAELYDLVIDFKDTIIIGDTIYDVRCAKYAGAVSVAVGTGWGDSEKLKNENPDYYFDDLSNIDEFMKILED
ncbi:MAG: HAD hydrolase-like protein [Spirochaetes bacterium]|nr:HAD hydrolase-like protein [Spirochaetota bacterium]